MPRDGRRKKTTTTSPFFHPTIHPHHLFRASFLPLCVFPLSEFQLVFLASFALGASLRTLFSVSFFDFVLRFHHFSRTEQQQLFPHFISPHRLVFPLQIARTRRRRARDLLSEEPRGGGASSTLLLPRLFLARSLFSLAFLARFLNSSTLQLYFLLSSPPFFPGLAPLPKQNLDLTTTARHGCCYGGYGEGLLFSFSLLLLLLETTLSAPEHKTLARKQQPRNKKKLFKLHTAFLLPLSAPRSEQTRREIAVSAAKGRKQRGRGERV